MWWSRPDRHNLLHSTRQCIFRQKVAWWGNKVAPKSLWKPSCIIMKTSTLFFLWEGFGRGRLKMGLWGKDSSGHSDVTSWQNNDAYTVSCIIHLNLLYYQRTVFIIRHSCSRTFSSKISNVVYRYRNKCSSKENGPKLTLIVSNQWFVSKRHMGKT